jgi:hypothetical protein
MRLTLRTLLCWLDDTLPPDEVRRIGQQVEESDLAREIVERIQRVTRRRRLTIPPATGADATDPNTVAEYLDNVMPADVVPEFERLCLKSDVHLAEVASAHQILSLLGQRAKVPAEARYRMYHLIQGRETDGVRARRDSSDVRVEPVASAPRWHAFSAQPSRPRNLATLAAALVLLALLGWSTWYNLSPSTDSPTREPSVDLRLLAARAASRHPAGAAAAAQPGLAKLGQPTEAGAGAAEGAGKAELAQTETPAPGPEGRQPETSAAMAATEPAKVAEPPVPGRVPNSARLTVAPSSAVLLRRDTAESPWERIKPGTDVSPGEELVNLEPFRSDLTLGPNTLTLIGGTSVQLQGDGNAIDPNLELERGRMVFRTGKDPAVLKILDGSTTVRLAIPGGTPVGLERLSSWVPGAQAAKPPLVIHVAEGELGIRGADGEKKVKGGTRVKLAARGAVAADETETIPAWVIETEPPIIEQEEAKQFGRFFKPDQRPLPNLVEASASDRPEIRRHAYRGLAALNQLSVVISALSAEGQPETRRMAINAVRETLALGPAGEQRVLDELQRKGDGGNWAPAVLSLLKGVDPVAASDPTIRTELLQDLRSKDLAIRELALDNLREITRRGDNLGFDPDDPREEGIRAWQAVALPDAEAKRKTGRP